MDRNITIIGLVLTPSEKQQFSMSFRTVPGTIMVVWILGAKSSASSVSPLGDCLFFVHFADVEAVVPTAPSTGLVGSHLGIQFGASHCTADMDQSQGRAEERIEGKHLRSCKERWKEFFV